MTHAIDDIISKFICNFPIYYIIQYLRDIMIYIYNTYKVHNNIFCGRIVYNKYLET